MKNLSMTKKVAALAGFMALALSPSYVDWEQSPEKRPQIVGYYGIALILVYYGILSG